MDSSTRNFQSYKLVLATVLGFPIIPTVILVGGFVGSSLHSNPSFATLPVATVILGNVIGILPANFLSQKIGRKKSFLIGTLHAQIFSLLAVFAIYQELFWLFCFTTFALGNSVSFFHQYRFAGVELIPEDPAKAISRILVGGIFGGILGPFLAKQSIHWFSADYAGCFLVLGILNFLCFLLLSTYQHPENIQQKATDTKTERPYFEIITQPIFVLAVLIAAFGYGLMALLMTAAPLSMKQDFSFDISFVTFVIQTHLIAMYLPSLWSDYAIKKLGILKFILVGFLLNYASYTVGYTLQNDIGFWFSLLFLGVGWNMLFVGGTYLVTKSYFPMEKFKAQTTNDFLIFGVQAFGALSSGALLHLFSWQILNIIGAVVLSLVLIIFLRMRKSLTVSG